MHRARGCRSPRPGESGPQKVLHPLHDLAGNDQGLHGYGLLGATDWGDPIIGTARTTSTRAQETLR